MTLRSFASSLTIASFIAVSVTGLCLFFGYRGGAVDPVHEASSLLFVLGSLLHITVNRKLVVTHLKRPLGAILAALFLVVTIAGLVANDGGAFSGGNPARKSVELMMDADLTTIAVLTKTAEPVLQARLERHGFSPAAGHSVRQIAASSQRNPMEILRLLISE